MNIYEISEKYEAIKRSAVRHSAIQMTDNRHMTVEECLGVELFDENLIKLVLGFGRVTITGLELKMRNYSGRGVIITGKIHSVGFEEGAVK